MKQTDGEMVGPSGASRPRNPAIDLYRILMMFGIILLHVISFSGLDFKYWNQYQHLGSLLMPCVCGFVLISGYCSVKFSLRKIGLLYGTAIWCLFLISCVSDCSFRCLVGFFDRFWFLHSYVFLICLAPCVNFIVGQGGGGQSLILPFLGVVFGWGFLSHFAGFQHYVPHLSGLDSMSGLTLLGIYVVGRLYRKYESRFDAVSIWAWLGMTAVLGAWCFWGWGFGTYNSPIAVLFALSGFHGVKHLPVPQWIERVSVWCAPSVFSVYILHANSWAYSHFQRILPFLVTNTGSLVLSFLLLSVAVFVAAVIVDLPRRFALIWLRRVG